MLEFYKNEENVYRKAFSCEIKKAADGLASLEELIRNTEQSDDTRIILKNMRVISMFCSVLETFNENIETLIAGIDKETFAQAMKSRQINVNRLRVKDWIRSDLSDYRVGDTIQAMISFVFNTERNLCFVQDATKKQSSNFYEHIECQFNELPDVGIVFGINVNSKCFRGIRIDAEPTNIAIRIRLIDIGETISVSPNADLYHLTIEAQKMPPMAILCRVEKMDGCPVNTLDELKRWFSYKLTISDICVNLLVVDLVSVFKCEKELSIKTLHDSISEVTSQSDASMQNTMLINSSYTSSGTSFSGINRSLECDDSFTNKELETTLPEPEMMPSIRLAPPLPPVPPRQVIRIPMRVVQRIANGNAKLLNQEIEEVNNGHIDQNGNVGLKNGSSNISNENIEVKNQSQVCIFPTVPPRLDTNQPRKNCIERNLEHQKSSNEIIDQNCNGEQQTCSKTDKSCDTGAYPKRTNTNQSNLRDFLNQSPLEIDTQNLLMSPPIGKEIEIVPRHVVNYEEIYAHVLPIDKRFEDIHDTIQNIQSQLKPLNYIPRANDFLLARFSYDKAIYRAKVIDILDQRTINVFYIDYGNIDIVNIDDLYDWTELCEAIPPQAIYFRLENVRSIHNISEDDVAIHLQEKYLNKSCRAVIVGKSHAGLLINLKDSYGYDVADEILNHFNVANLQGSIV